MHIRNSFEEFQIIPWHKAKKDQEYVIFTTESAACTFLSRFIYDPFNLQCLHRFCERENCFLSFHRAGIDEMMLHLARSLYLERFYLLRQSENGKSRAIGSSGSGNGGRSGAFKDPLLPLLPKKKTVPQNFPDIFQAGPVRPAEPECQLISSRVACSHGRRASSEGLLEVVPAETGDVITLSAAAVGQCGDHPEWKIGGFWTSTEKGEETSFRALSWQALKPYWLSHILPHVYRVSVDCCAGDGRTYDIRAYPSDQLSIKFSKGNWVKLEEKLNNWVKKILGAYLAHPPKFEILTGSGTISAGWQEYEEDHRAFYKYEITAGFNPVIGGKFRVPFRPTATIPQWIKKYGDAPLFLELSGGVKLNGHWGRKSPDEHSAWADAAGYINGKIGASLYLIDKKKLATEVTGGTGISLEAGPGEKPDKPEIKVQFKWEGFKGTLSVKVFAWVEIGREFNLVDGGPVGKPRYFKIPFTD